MNRIGKKKTLTVFQDTLCVTRLQLVVSVFGRAASCALDLPWKCLVTLHPFQAPASPNPTKAPWGGMFLCYYKAGAEQNDSYSPNPATVKDSDGRYDLKSFPLTKAQLIHQLPLALQYSQMKHRFRPVRCDPSCPVCELPSLIGYICFPPVLRLLLFCSQEKGMSPPERLITFPSPHFRVHAHVLVICTQTTVSKHRGG